MIFVTVGTTMPFDELLQEVDRLAGAGVLDEPVLCQTGQSQFKILHCEHFHARKTLDDLMAASSFVITHGGATVVQLLMARKPFVAFPNPRGAGDHQTAFLRRVSTVADVSWSPRVDDLERLFHERRAAGPSTVDKAFPRARDIVLRSLSAS